MNFLFFFHHKINFWLSILIPFLLITIFDTAILYKIKFKKKIQPINQNNNNQKPKSLNLVVLLNGLLLILLNIPLTLAGIFSKQIYAREDGSTIMASLVSLSKIMQVTEFFIQMFLNKAFKNEFKVIIKWN